jgi:hypothetical protein
MTHLPPILTRALVPCPCCSRRRLHRRRADVLEQLASLAAGLSPWQVLVLAATVATVAVTLIDWRRR